MNVSSQLINKMASSLYLIILFIIAFVFINLSSVNASVKFKPRALVVPVKKDNITLQYIATIQMGTPPEFIDVVIDLGGQFLWLDCVSNYNSSTYRPVSCGSSKCKIAKGVGCLGCNAAPRPGCTNNTCALGPSNPFQDFVVAGGLGEDNMTVSSTLGVQYYKDVEMRRFPFACGSTDQLTGLANGTRGMLGLSRSRIALPTQLSVAFKISSKFALCLPSSSEDIYSEYGSGNIFIGGGPYYLPPYTEDVSKLLIKTPLLINPVSTAPVYAEGDSSDEYFIDVNSIRIDGKDVPFNTSLLSIDKNGVGGTKFSTITAYTKLHSSIYKPLVNDFIKKAESKKMKRVTTVAPFGACFSSNSIANTTTGPAVPTIDLVLQGNNTYWRIYGANSMVKVKNKDVLCLGFIDGGPKPRTSMVIGGYQLEDNMLEFDFSSSTLGFSSSLRLHNTGCNHFSIY